MLDKEIESYLRRISHLRAEEKHGRAVQYCDAALEKVTAPKMKGTVLTFKADSLYNIGKRTRQEEVMRKARSCYLEALAINPSDFIAKQGLERIERYYL